MENCSHRFVESKGFWVCRECGLVSPGSIFSNHIKIQENTPDNAFRNGFLDPRLSKYNHFYTQSPAKSDYTESRLLKTCNTLGIPDFIVKNAFYRYKKVSKTTKILNNITCIALCIWEAIKHANYPLTLNELCQLFQDRGHRVTQRLLLRAELRYYSFKPVQRGPLNYVPKLINGLRQNKEIVNNRLRSKARNKYKTTEHYFMTLEFQALQVWEKIEVYLRLHGPNPVNVSAGLLYFADIVISLKNSHGQVLTQKLLSKCTGISDFSIRDAYRTHFKKFNPKIRGNRTMEKVNFDLIRIEQVGKIPGEKIAALLQFLLEKEIKFELIKFEHIGE